MSQYNGTISTGQSTEASSSRIYIECFHTQITSKCPILYKHSMNQSREFKAISSVYRKTREFKTDVCVLKSLLSGRVDHSPQSTVQRSFHYWPVLPQTHKISVLPTPIESGNGFWVVLYLGGSGFSEISSIQPF